MTHFVFQKLFVSILDLPKNQTRMDFMKVANKKNSTACSPKSKKKPSEVVDVEAVDGFDILPLSW